MKKQLIKEVDKKGDVWYYVSIDGERISSFFIEAHKDVAIEFYNNINTPITPSTEVIKEE